MTLSSPYTDSLWEEYSGISAVDVVLDVDVPDLQETYSYRLPEDLRDLPVGACVHVPFAGRDLLGYVVARRLVPLSDPLAGKLKAVIARVDQAAELTDELVSVARWMSDRYLCDLRTAIRCILPSAMSAHVRSEVHLADAEIALEDVGDSVAQAHVVATLNAMGGRATAEDLRERANIPGFSAAYAALLKKRVVRESRAVVRGAAGEKLVRAYRLGGAAGQLAADGAARRPAPQQARVLDLMRQAAQCGQDTVPAPALLQQGASAGAIRTLVSRGLLEETSVRVRRALTTAPDLLTTAPALSGDQQRAAAALRECLASGAFQPVLLFGVTASGKTEVYLDAIAQTLAAGKTALALVPEIALTSQVVDIFTSRFGDLVAVIHSALSEGERYDEWTRIRDGHARIVVGARSAVFAPLENIGLVVVDEEHEASYKQENTPRYNAKELAQERASWNRATLLLGSATPSLEAFYASASALDDSEASPPSLQALTPCPLSHVWERGEGLRESHDNPEPGALNTMIRLELRQRVLSRPLPYVAVVDMREEFKQRRAMFSERLTEAMAARLRAGQQTILFLNRRGYAQFVLCRDCGYTARCPNCAVSLAFHAAERLLRCHHCDHAQAAPRECPDCGGPKVRAFGFGTEKVEEEVLSLFPAARVARMDRDTTSRKGAHAALVRTFRRGEADILIGTQMVAKGLDFPNVTLVGVVSADTSINMPDFRAAERTFQLLTQVAGRAGRGEQPGEVVIQTFSPEHYAVQAAMRQNYEAFYRQELLFRRELGYPPFSRFANLVCAHEREDRARARADRVAQALRAVAPAGVEVIGPAPAPLARLKNHFRFHVAVRAPADAPLSAIIRSAFAALAPGAQSRVTIDMDPQSMI